MAGARRNLLAELAAKGITGEAAMARIRADALRNETGRSVHSPAARKADKGEYLGKNGTDARP